LPFRAQDSFGRIQSGALRPFMQLGPVEDRGDEVEGPIGVDHVWHGRMLPSLSHSHPSSGGKTVVVRLYATYRGR
jgi:hypothetical protein